MKRKKCTVCGSTLQQENEGPLCKQCEEASAFSPDLSMKQSAPSAIERIRSREEALAKRQLQKQKKKRRKIALISLITILFVALSLLVVFQIPAVRYQLAVYQIGTDNARAFQLLNSIEDYKDSAELLNELKEQAKKEVLDLAMAKEYEAASSLAAKFSLSEDLVSACKAYHDDDFQRATFLGLTDIVIPRHITYIEKEMFSHCNITSITFHEGVTGIDDFAFYYCTKLSSVALCEGVTKIGNYAFHQCSSLTSIDIPASVTEIGRSAFSCCSSLETVTFSPTSSLANIDYDAFSQCSALRSVTLPDSLENLSERLFEECTSLSTVTFPAHLKSISKQAFAGCSSLSSIALPSTLIRIDDSAFWGCLALTDITIPESAISIGKEILFSCINVKHAKVPVSVVPQLTSKKLIDLTTFGFGPLLTNAFKGRSQLESVSLSEGVTQIEYHAFLDCTSLKTLYVPLSVTRIQQEALYNCSNLQRIDYAGTIEQWLAIAPELSQDDSVGYYIVNCSDGAITKDGNRIQA